MFLASDEAPFVFGAYAAHLDSRLHREQSVALSPAVEVDQTPTAPECDEPVERPVDA